ETNKMKYAFLAIVAVTCCKILTAQPTAPNQPATDPANAQAPFLRFPTLPPFHLLKLDSSTYLTKDDLKKHRRTLIMFFSPDCDHCKHQTEAILEVQDKFKDIEIVMATYQPFEEMKAFNAHYRIFE